MFWMILLAVVVVIVVLIVLGLRKAKRSAAFMARLAELKAKEEAEIADNRVKKEQERKELETRAAAGDETAKQKLIDQGTDIHCYWMYKSEKFDSNFFMMVQTAELAARAKILFPLLEDGELIKTHEEKGMLFITRVSCEGKTPRGDTRYVLYTHGSIQAIDYQLHLKALPEEARVVGDIIDKFMQNYIDTFQ